MLEDLTISLIAPLPISEESRGNSLSYPMLVTTLCYSIRSWVTEPSLVSSGVWTDNIPIPILIDDLDNARSLLTWWASQSILYLFIGIFPYTFGLADLETEGFLQKTAIVFRFIVMFSLRLIFSLLLVWLNFVQFRDSKFSNYIASKLKFICKHHKFKLHTVESIFWFAIIMIDGLWREVAVVTVCRAKPFSFVRVHLSSSTTLNRNWAQYDDHVLWLTLQDR